MAGKKQTKKNKSKRKNRPRPKKSEVARVKSELDNILDCINLINIILKGDCKLGTCTCCETRGDKKKVVSEVEVIKSQVEFILEKIPFHKNIAMNDLKKAKEAFVVAEKVIREDIAKSDKDVITQMQNRKMHKGDKLLKKIEGLHRKLSLLSERQIIVLHSYEDLFAQYDHLFEAADPCRLAVEELLEDARKGEDVRAGLRKVNEYIEEVGVTLPKLRAAKDKIYSIFKRCVL